MFNQLTTKAIAFVKNPTINSNATITFQEADGNITDYDSVGNPIITHNTVTITAYLRLSLSRIANNPQEGLDRGTNYYEGRLVNPKTYQIPFNHVGDIEITLNGRKGILTQLDNFETPYSQQDNLSALLGQRIYCYITFEQNY